jgi:hypothetical protein
MSSFNEKETLNNIVDRYIENNLKLGVVGGRDFNDYELLKLTLDQFKHIKLIVSGGAQGADKLAERYARERGIETLIIKPEWNKYGKSAGPIRNQQIVLNCHKLIAFWDGQSKGTFSSIEIARMAAIECEIIRY